MFTKYKLQHGIVFTDSKEDADLWLLNSCTVKNPAEDHFRNEIKKAKDLNKYIVIAGCVPQGQPRGEYMKVRLTLTLNVTLEIHFHIYLMFYQLLTTKALINQKILQFFHIT